ncbi:putative toxin-antitoxin system toxin component, PIN family [Pelagicoccus mobilis]|uniref:Toxin-antitoxin system toxin component, PIN family n=1 Tax=Pelagicoccus mobilis TaxID=415221 RepID=A0A934RRQ5_9BACT|nr:putative toxin-antitoxin system toxin component, PIN family [Pelagicoccus mobilis]MBK1875672.1 putative toxin-antitoxin system toxin component, PIN family [Pelagicoccus mobilis]
MLVVLDSNVLYAGLYSSKGASYLVLQDIADLVLSVGLSVGLYEEYSDVLRRPPLSDDFTNEEAEAILDFICSRATLLDVFFLWRPVLKDPKDDLVLEAAVAFGADAILTHNTKDFSGCEKFGIKVLSPGEYLKEKEKR